MPTSQLRRGALNQVVDKRFVRICSLKNLFADLSADAFFLETPGKQPPTLRIFPQPGIDERLSVPPFIEGSFLRQLFNCGGHLIL